MATYLVGDLHGCYDELQMLLDKVRFDPAVDRLYLVGDLVARGDKSLSCLRLVKSLGEAAQTVLGAAKMVLESPEHPERLKDRVCSPGGATIAGVRVLEEGGFKGLVMKAVHAGRLRMEEVGRTAD